ncbi:hypothetical protein L388_03728 [Klebsiella oxytoca MGH 42]|nr:hypothetical protein EGY21_09165 [Klebsiella oxytoca]ESM68804.1 hypothetical protein L388_03728 [Klebsiella oxytoca MGH 42]PDO74788.1 hypothetical protein CPZ29_06505 [Klebsiella oxytoca]
MDQITNRRKVSKKKYMYYRFRDRDIELPEWLFFLIHCNLLILNCFYFALIVCGVIGYNKIRFNYYM